MGPRHSRLSLNVNSEALPNHPIQSPSPLTVTPITWPCCAFYPTLVCLPDQNVASMGAGPGLSCPLPQLQPSGFGDQHARLALKCLLRFGFCSKSELQDTQWASSAVFKTPGDCLLSYRFQAPVDEQQSEHLQSMYDSMNEEAQAR